MCLMCTNGESLRHGYLAAEGFGSQMCHLEPEPRNQVCVCVCAMCECGYVRMSVHRYECVWSM